MTKAQKQEQQEAITQLREWIKPGDTVYTVLEHVSRSGMQREIRVVVPYVRREEVPSETQTRDSVDFLHPNYSIAKALGLRQGKRDGLIIGGCGMDMGFALVHELSYALYGKGYQCLGKGKCPSAYHVNHRDTIQCPAGCRWERGQGWTVPEGDGTRLCAMCRGEGRVPNPDGPERFDLLHTDGYALRHRWL